MEVLFHIIPKTQKFSTAVEFVSATTLTAGVARPYYIRPLELKGVFVSLDRTK